MTPEEQDKEIRKEIISILRDSKLDIVDDADDIMQLITADRKRVALEARINENNMYIRELPRHYFPSGPGEPHIPLVQFHERIAELKAEKEEV